MQRMPEISRQQGQQFLTSLFHLAGGKIIPFVVVAEEVQDAMHQKTIHHRLQRGARLFRLAPGGRKGDHYVSEQVGVQVAELPLPHGEGQDVGGTTALQVAPVERAYLFVPDQYYAEFAVRTGQGV